ncbi:eCIS core domain-containing protein [Pseudanabaena minima]|uniref:eCIS core domain-containing protein n=1 Tax=Pseudanabaena minima TaxID=890415 RepID=UPI003DA8D72F
MSRTYDNEKKPSQITTSVQPKATYLQTRGFASLQTDLNENATFRSSGYTENFLEKIISQRSNELSDTPVQAKTMNRLMMKPLQTKRMVIQSKLSIGEPNDKYEQEADATASKVIQQINSPTQDQSVQRESMEEEEELQMKPISSIQRESMEEEEELQMKSLVQRHENLGGGEASTDLESSIQSARGGGQSLDTDLQQSMGQAMGADFSGVKVHTDSHSDQLNQSIQAKAFTTGHDVFFRQGAYDPSSKSGQELIAHELTHVVQQNGKGANVPNVSTAPESVQRLISAASFKKKTKLTARKGKSAQVFVKLKQGLDAYENANTEADKLTFLEQILNIAEAWENSPDSNTSSRKKYVTRLIQEVKNEIDNLLLSLDNLQDDAFDEDVNQPTGGKIDSDGQMSEVSKLKYKFGVRKNKTGDLKTVEGGEFEGYFKAQVDEDKVNSRHRGAEKGGSGIPEKDPKFVERNIAMYRLDQLLNANVIPPTFKAKFNGEAGLLMQAAVGKSGKDLSTKIKQARNKDTNEGDSEASALQAILNSGITRHALSNLFLLDIIAGQVDRHYGNYIVELDEQNKAIGVKGIDNDIAFGKNYKDIDYAQDYGQFAHQLVAGKFAQELEEIDSEFAQKIVDLSSNPNVLRDALQDLLSDEEINSTISRLNSLAKYLQKLISEKSNRLKGNDEWQDK